MTPDEMDAAILAAVSAEWTKTAAIVTRVAPNDAIAQSAVVNRIRSLVAARRIQARGNLGRWRLSEVRLPPTFGLQKA